MPALVAFVWPHELHPFINYASAGDVQSLPAAV